MKYIFAKNTLLRLDVLLSEIFMAGKVRKTGAKYYAKQARPEWVLR